MPKTSDFLLYFVYYLHPNVRPSLYFDNIQRTTRLYKTVNLTTALLVIGIPAVRGHRQNPRLIEVEPGDKRRQRSEHKILKLEAQYRLPARQPLQ